MVMFLVNAKPKVRARINSDTVGEEEERRRKFERWEEARLFMEEG